MEAPKCKLCDKRHYGMCAKVANKIQNAAITKVVADVVTNPVKKSYEVPDEDEYQKFLKAKEWKKNYMRAYMRNRRAK